MALPLSIPIAFTSGLSLAWVAREPLRTAVYPSRTRYFGATALFAGTALTPAILILFLLFPDWSLMYLTSPGHLPVAAMAPLVTITAFSAPLAGFFIAQRLIASGRPGPIKTIALVFVGIAAMNAAFGHEALGQVGYFESFHYDGPMVPFVKSPALSVVTGAGVIVLLMFALTYRGIQKHIRALADVEEGLPVRPDQPLAPEAPTYGG